MPTNKTLSVSTLARNVAIMTTMGLTTPMMTTTSGTIQFPIPVYAIKPIGRTSTSTYKYDFVIPKELSKNLEKIQEIANLKENWNGNEASPFPVQLINRVKNLIYGLNIQPEIFPTACNSIQLEYSFADGRYFEIEVGDRDTAEVFQVDSKGNEEYKVITLTADAINDLVGGVNG